MSTPEHSQDHRIRSYVRRQGRMTASQQYALEQLWSHYVLDPAQNYDLTACFGRKADLILEIGFGNGDSLCSMAQANPHLNYLGIEVHRPGVGHLMLRLQEERVENVRIYCHDAVEILEQSIPDASLAGVQLFFPDPWHKTRHHKRRIVRPEFLDLLHKKLQTGAYFHAATDWENYAEQILALLTAHPGFRNSSPSGAYCERPDYRPLTKFENRGLKLGHGVWDIIFLKRNESKNL